MFMPWAQGRSGSGPRSSSLPERSGNSLRRSDRQRTTPRPPTGGRGVVTRGQMLCLVAGFGILAGRFAFFAFGFLALNGFLFRGFGCLFGGLGDERGNQF